MTTITPEDLRLYAERQAAIETAINHNQAGADASDAEATALEAELTTALASGVDPADIKTLRHRLADLQYARDSALAANKALEPEYAECLAGPPEREEPTP